MIQYDKVNSNRSNSTRIMTIFRVIRENEKRQYAWGREHRIEKKQS